MRLGIRTKLALALAVPLTALGAFTAIPVVEARADAREVRREADIATAALGPQGLVTAVFDEGAMAAIYASGTEKIVTLPVDDNRDARAKTDRARRGFSAVLDRSGPEVRRAYGPAVDALDALDGLRAQLDGIAGPRSIETTADLANVFYEKYSGLSSGLLDATTRLSTNVRDPRLRVGAALVADAARARAEEGQVVRMLGLGQVSGGGLDTTELGQAALAVSSLRRRLDAIQLRATAGYGPSVDTLLATPRIRSMLAFADESLTTKSVDLLALQKLIGDEQGEGFERFLDEVSAILVRRADDLRATASTEQRSLVTLGAVAFAGTVLLTWLVARSITRPLRFLAAAATDVASRHLPEAVRGVLSTPPGTEILAPEAAAVGVRSRDEVADVADALHDAQGTALGLAVEQAALRRNLADAFIYLGRRNQALIARQLELVTLLETHETDPEALRNLFHLDHLATRMRRNADSLLVLGGLRATPPWATPVSIDRILRAALGEIEDYNRVAWRWVEPAVVVGSVTADLTHLLAELLENAVTATPGGFTVEVAGQKTAHGYSLGIIDAGHGLTDTDLDNANRRLRGHAPRTATPSHGMGHYVAGLLAARHGIRVTLENSPGRGITAVIDLPPSLLVHQQSESTGALQGAFDLSR